MSEHFPGPERRKDKRWRLARYVRVYSKGTDRPLGHLVNLHTKGMGVLSSNSIPKGHNFSLRLDVPRDDGRQDKILIYARSVWSARNAEVNVPESGFRIRGSNLKSKERLRRLVEALQYQA